MAQTIRIPAAITGMPQASFQGLAYWDILSLTTIEAGIFTFVKNTEGKLYGQVTVPKNLSGTTGSLVLLLKWANVTASVASRMSVKYKAVASGESGNPATLDSVTAQDVACPTTAYQHTEASFSLTGLAADDVVYFELFHEGAHANDTVDHNTLLVDCYLQCDVN